MNNEGNLAEERTVMITNFLYCVAEAYTVVVREKRSCIIDGTPPGFRQSGKLYIIDEVGERLKGMSVENFWGSTPIEIADELETGRGVANLLEKMMSEKTDLNEDFLGGMTDAAAMVGGYIALGIIKTLKKDGYLEETAV